MTWIWADVVFCAGMLAIGLGAALVRYCWRKAEESEAIPHRNNHLCDCAACVQATCAQVERDTQKVTR